MGTLGTSGHLNKFVRATPPPPPHPPLLPVILIPQCTGDKLGEKKGGPGRVELVSGKPLLPLQTPIHTSPPFSYLRTSVISRAWDLKAITQQRREKWPNIV